MNKRCIPLETSKELIFDVFIDLELSIALFKPLLVISFATILNFEAGFMPKRSQ